MRLRLPAFALLLVACGGTGAANGRPQPPVPDRSARRASPSPADRANVERLERALVDDSMEGRLTGSRGEDRASGFLAGEMKRIGLAPGGDHGSYLQDVLLRRSGGTSGRSGLAVVIDRAVFDTI